MRNVIRAIVLASTLTACGGSVDTSSPVSPASTAKPSQDSCSFMIGDCKYSYPILHNGPRELYCPVEPPKDAQIIDVVCGAAAIPTCHSDETCK